MVVLLKSIKAHPDKAWDLSSHNKLPLLASASSDKTSKIYKLSEEQNFPLIATLDDTHKRSVRSVAFKPHLVTSENDFIDLPALACGSFDSTISVWGIDEPEEFLDQESDNEDPESDDALKTEREIEILSSSQNEWNLMALIEGHENEIKSVAWNKSGNLLASCSRDKTIWIWETDAETLEEFECVAVLSDHEHDIKHITWHPCINILASSSYDDTVRIFKQDDDDDDWACVAILNGHKGTVWCSQFESPQSPHFKEDTLRLVSASDDMTVRVWRSVLEKTSRKKLDIPSSLKHEKEESAWELECLLPEVHKYPIYSVAWSPQTGKIASTGSDGLLAVYKETGGTWEVESVRKSAHGVFEINKVLWCQLSNRKEVLVTAGDDGRINLWRSE